MDAYAVSPSTSAALNTRRGMLARMVATLTIVLAAVLALGGAAPAAQAAGKAAAKSAKAAADADASAYQIYPTPHTVTYGAAGNASAATQTLRARATTVIEDGIDADTTARLQEALKLKGITATSAHTVPTAKGTTSILVGVKGSNGAVDQHVAQLKAAGKLVYADDLFTADNHNDAYLLASLPASVTGAGDQIIVLGRDTDAAYYGLTTLYQIFQQIEGAKLRAFTVQDYADVITRGFIEGYYGNPWSTQDRINLMTWGGYYKLNAYVYAPKDDPKHNSKWRELYTEEELKEKVAPLAEAGNKSKVRFVYAIHPFMSNPITTSNYDASVQILKEKFTQVMDNGVRQISILADDAGNQGSALYTKLCKDMTDWLHEQQKATNADGTLKYPGLKDTLIFCPVNYMGNGESWYSDLPSNVQVVNTGGRVWGKVTNNFVSTFKNNSGVAPFMWVNWPCSDNDKDALHMGGHNEFLGADVQPGSVKGVVLNPMQQSEPSKQGIFMNADFSWNLWKSTDHANQAWEDSFSYIDHNSPNATAASDALHDLSEHMLRIYGGGATWVNGESDAIKDKLTAFTAALNAGNVTDEQIAEMTTIFTKLQTAAKTYRAGAGDANMFTQIEPWISTWDDLTAAALADLAALKAESAGDTATMLAQYQKATSAYNSSKGHGFHYVDHTEYAKVGKVYLSPAVDALHTYVDGLAATATNPNAVITRFVTSRTDAPAAGTVDQVFDGNAATGPVYKTPNQITAGLYFGVTKSKAFDVTRVTFTQGGGKDFIQYPKLQSMDADGNWTDVAGQTELTGASVIDITGLNLKDVYGVRLVARQANAQDAWPTIYEIEINKGEDDGAESGPVTGTVTAENQVVDNGSLSNLADGNTTTFAWMKKGGTDNTRDTTVVDASFILTFAQASKINRASFVQVDGTTGDGIVAGKLEYKDAAGTWHELAVVGSGATQNFTFDTVEATAIRVRNTQETAKWWKAFEFSASYEEEGDSTASGTLSLANQVEAGNSGHELAKANDGNLDTSAWLKSASADRTDADAQLILTFAKAMNINTVTLNQGDSGSTSDIIDSGKIEYQAEDGTWTKVANVVSATDHTYTFATVKAKAVRVVNGAQKAVWWRVRELSAGYKAPSKDKVFTNIENVKLGSTHEGTEVTLDDGSATFANGSYLALDLGSVRNGVAIDKGSTTLPAGTSLVYSQNGLEWTAYTDGAKDVKARYVGVKATADATVSFKGFAASYATKAAPSTLKSDVGTFDATNVFDGDVTTSFKNTQGANAGNKLVFDLGQERTITSVAYWIPEASLDFIRKAVVEASNDPDAADAQWTPVLYINKEDATVANTYNTDTAKDAAFLTHSTAKPGNMYTANPKTADTTGNENDPNGTIALNVKARYLRIRFTATYTQRWIQIGELQINGGEFVGTYGDADIVTDGAEVQGASPANLVDGDTATVWEPATETGSFTWNVSTPLDADGDPYSGVRIVSSGAPSNATVKATVYTDAAFTKTAEVPLGTLGQLVSEFRFGDAIARARAAQSFSAVKSVTVSWNGVKPQISELFLMDGLTAADTTELQKAVDAAKAVITDSWTASSKAALTAALKLAEEALANGNAAQSYVDSATAALTAAQAAGVAKYTGTELGTLTATKIENADGAYTAASYQTYAAAYDAAKAALENADDLSQTDGEALANALKAAKDALEFDSSARDRATQAKEDAEDIQNDGYTEDSWNDFQAKLTALKEAIANTGATPQALSDATKALVTAQDALKKSETPEPVESKATVAYLGTSLRYTSDADLNKAVNGLRFGYEFKATGNAQIDWAQTGWYYSIDQNALKDTTKLTGTKHFQAADNKIENADKTGTISNIVFTKIPVANWVTPLYARVKLVYTVTDANGNKTEHVVWGEQVQQDSVITAATRIASTDKTDEQSQKDKAFAQKLLDSDDKNNWSDYY